MKEQEVWEPGATKEYESFFADDTQPPSSAKMISLEPKSEYSVESPAAAPAAALAAVVSAAAGFAETASKSSVSTAVSEALTTQGLEEAKKKYSKYVKGLRPWREFLLQYQKPQGEGVSKVMANFYAFQTNYVLVFLAYFATQVMQDTRSLMLIVASCAAWAFFSKKNEDPEWNPTVAGIALPPTMRAGLMGTATVVLFLVVSGNLLISCAFFYLIAAGIHAYLHAPAIEAEIAARADDTVDL
eukprot:CAMPEP_0178465626 /NCGR_PEP_ID=MMETSP0689_2-20121128/51458_1 /TAXON_ID=160604 /ORGANISM="Amphidinium massartii, Strain CS-259" /LENGTH=242 /DNA_ID=CAMNT_0020092571 /DNA_START=97 /DNA_END=826 /DNA_ORIENTATION=-